MRKYTTKKIKIKQISLQNVLLAVPFWMLRQLKNDPMNSKMLIGSFFHMQDNMKDTKKLKFLPRRLSHHIWNTIFSL